MVQYVTDHFYESCKGHDVLKYIYIAIQGNASFYRIGMALLLVLEWLDHAQINTTRDYYANADTEMKRKAINSATLKLNPVKLDDYDFDFDNDDELIKKLYELK